MICCEYAQAKLRPAHFEDYALHISGCGVLKFLEKGEFTVKRDTRHIPRRVLLPRRLLPTTCPPGRSGPTACLPTAARCDASESKRAAGLRVSGPSFRPELRLRQARRYCCAGLAQAGGPLSPPADLRAASRLLPPLRVGPPLQHRLRLLLLGPTSRLRAARPRVSIARAGIVELLIY